MTDEQLPQVDPLDALKADIEKLGHHVAEAAACRDWADYRLRKMVEEMSESKRIAGLVLFEGILANCMGFLRAEAECAQALLTSTALAGDVAQPAQGSTASMGAELAEDDFDLDDEDGIVAGVAPGVAEPAAFSPLTGHFTLPAVWPGTGLAPEARDARRIEMLSNKLDLFLGEWQILKSARAQLVGVQPVAGLNAEAILAVQDYCRAIINAGEQEQRLFLSFATWVNALWDVQTSEQCAGLYPAQGEGRSGGGGSDLLGVPAISLAVGAALGWVAQFLLT